MAQGTEKTMKIQLFRLIAATALLFGSGGVALAATVDFDPNPIFVASGETFDLDIIGTDFFTSLAGGTFDLGFDSAKLQINSVTINTATYDFLPDGGGLLSPGLWGTVGFDTFATAPVGNMTIATVNLTALMIGSSEVVILNSEFFDDGTIGLLNPTLQPGVVNAVPVPAAVWLFGSGLLGLVGVARRKIA
jgi:hypothetical protein